MQERSAPSLARAYFRLVRMCQTPNQLNSLHIQLERRMTPYEQAFLLDWLRAGLDVPLWSRILFKLAERLVRRGISLPSRLRHLLMARETQAEWANRLARNSQSPMALVERWERQYLTPGSVLFRRIDIRGERVTVGFTGSARRMMMATPDFLQEVEALHTDVLMVFQVRGRRYASGIAGLGEDFPRSLHEIRRLVSELGYSETICMGMSAGGAPALASLAVLAPSAILAVGAQARLPAGMESLWSTMIAGGQPPCHIILMIGEEAPDKDRLGVEFWSRDLVTEVIIVPGAGHNAFPHYLKVNRLEVLFS